MKPSQSLAQPSEPLSRSWIRVRPQKLKRARPHSYAAQHSMFSSVAGPEYMKPDRLFHALAFNPLSDWPGNTRADL